MRRVIKFWNSATKTKQHSLSLPRNRDIIYGIYESQAESNLEMPQLYFGRNCANSGTLYKQGPPNKPDLANFPTSSTWSLSLESAVEDIIHIGLISSGSTIVKVTTSIWALPVWWFSMNHSWISYKARKYDGQIYIWRGGGEILRQISGTWRGIQIFGRTGWRHR